MKTAFRAASCILGAAACVAVLLGRVTFARVQA